MLNKRYIPVEIENLILELKNKDEAAELYATWHDGNFPSDILKRNFISASNWKTKGESLEEAAEDYATWHDGNLPKEMLMTDFISAYKLTNK